MMTLGWLLKSTINFVWLYFREQQGIDLAIALVFFGLTLDRLWSIWATLIIRPVQISDPLYDSLLWRAIQLLVLNCLLLFFDWRFYRHKPHESS